MPEKITTIKRICQSSEIAEAKITPQQGVYLVAAAELRHAIDVLKNARVVDGRAPQDIGPISEGLIDRLGLRRDSSL
jgi:hypothetical protein